MCQEIVGDFWAVWKGAMGNELWCEFEQFARIQKKKTKTNKKTENKLTIFIAFNVFVYLFVCTLLLFSLSLPLFVCVCVPTIHQECTRTHAAGQKYFHCRFVQWCNRRMWCTSKYRWSCTCCHHCLVNNSIKRCVLRFWFIEQISWIAIGAANRQAHTLTLSHKNI